MDEWIIWLIFAVAPLTAEIVTLTVALGVLGVAALITAGFAVVLPVRRHAPIAARSALLNRTDHCLDNNDHPSSAIRPSARPACQQTWWCAPPVSR